ncbi:MAG: glycosyltransferase family 1 protein [Nitrososphaerota archaeon]|nr:glycosyltransferase family 1 protein [Nitrososphaerota archaeon]
MVSSVFSKTIRTVQKGWARFQAYDLKLAYERGNSNDESKGTRQEFVAPEIIEKGSVWRENVLTDYRSKYANAQYRILFHMPPDGVGVIWFRDLAETLQHTGIECRMIPRTAKDFREQWVRFRPNIFIAVDEPQVLTTIDLDFIARYKKENGCLRMFSPVITHRFPKPGLSSEDRWRLELAVAGKSADVFFSMFADDFFDEFWTHWKNNGFLHLSLPNACNPFRHYPEKGIKKYDYFTVTSYSPDRANVTHRYLKPIFQNYKGVWAGPGWGFGEGRIDADSLRRYYAESRVSLGPLLPFLIQFRSEITERAFTTPACGGLLITNKTPITREFFNDDQLVSVETESEFIEAFRHYVNEPAERNAIILKGMREAFRRHTYFQRIDTLISFLRENEGKF